MSLCLAKGQNSYRYPGLSRRLTHLADFSCLLSSIQIYQYQLLFRNYSCLPLTPPIHSELSEILSSFVFKIMLLRPDVPTITGVRTWHSIPCSSQNSSSLRSTVFSATIPWLHPLFLVELLAHSIKTCCAVSGSAQRTHSSLSTRSTLAASS